MAKEPAITVLPAFLSQLASEGNRFHDLSIRMSKAFVQWPKTCSCMRRYGRTALPDSCSMVVQVSENTYMVSDYKWITLHSVHT